MAALENERGSKGYVREFGTIMWLLPESGSTNLRA